MFYSLTARSGAGIVSVIALLTITGCTSKQQGSSGIANSGNPNKTRQELTVGFLPVT